MGTLDENLTIRGQCRLLEKYLPQLETMIAVPCGSDLEEPGVTENTRFVYLSSDWRKKLDREEPLQGPACNVGALGRVNEFAKVMNHESKNFVNEEAREGKPSPFSFRAALRVHQKGYDPKDVWHLEYETFNVKPDGVRAAQEVVKGIFRILERQLPSIYAVLITSNIEK